MVKLNTSEEKPKPLLNVVGLKQYFDETKGVFLKKHYVIKAVDGVDLDILPSETVGLVGESGCGKSTLGRAILRLNEPTSGQIWFDGQDITQLDSFSMRALRKSMQIIFQDPFASLNPRMTVGNILQEPLIIHRLAKTPKERQEKVLELLSLVGLRSDALERYPHEFSGGQRQRIGIARALAVSPRFVVCDEPISALDVSIQAQIINLLQDLQYQLGLTYLFIAHDLNVVRHIASRIAVMYLGNIVEMGPAEEVYKRPKHPYTQALLSAVPSADPEKKSSRIYLKGEVPSPLNPPTGCKFHTRCSFVMPKCVTSAPGLKTIENKTKVACFLYSDETQSL